MSAVDLPHWEGTPGDAQRCLADIDRWVAELCRSEIVAAFSVHAAKRFRQFSGADIFDALESFSAAHWDFRGGRERNLAVPSPLTVAQTAAIDSVAGPLGLDGTPPPRCTGYDAIIMTGGMVRAGVVKPRYLWELSDNGLAWGEGIFLGGFRAFAGDEVELGQALGIAGANEFDAMTAGMRMAFDLGPPDAVEPIGAPAPSVASTAEWRDESWNWNGRTLRVVAAPSADPARRRANTVDTFRFWASRAHDIHSVLVVTTPVYVPYQGAVAVEVLGLEFGFSVETVAVSVSASDLGPNSQVFLPQHRLQELRSAIHGLRSLRSSLATIT